MAGSNRKTMRFRCLAGGFGCGFLVFLGLGSSSGLTVFLQGILSWCLNFFVVSCSAHNLGETYSCSNLNLLPMKLIVTWVLEELQSGVMKKPRKRDSLESGEVISGADILRFLEK